MKKYIKFFIFTCFCFIFTGYFAKADTVKFNGTTMTSSNYVVMNSGNRTILFNGSAVYSDISVFPQYFLITACADNSKITSWSINNSTLSTVNIYDTSYSCSFPNSSYTGGHIVYIYGSYNPATACNTNLMNCYQDGSFTFSNPSSSSWALLSYQNSVDSISIDYASNSIISQNNNIINQNNSIINQQQQIINQQQQNTQDIINNQNQNSQDIINQMNTTCKNGPISYDPFKYGFKSGTINSSGAVVGNSNSMYSPYLSIQGNTNYKINFGPARAGQYVCIYNGNKSVNTCYEMTGLLNFTSPNANNLLMRVVSVKSSGEFVPVIIEGPICNDWENEGLNNINSSINDDDTTGATSEASDFFSSFTSNTFGLTSIITAPLNLIQSLTSKTCSPLHIPLPYLNNKYLDLPCMTTIYSQYFGNFFTLYQTITFGIVAYWVCVRIFNQVKDFKNPEHDEIEVLDL